MTTYEQLDDIDVVEDEDAVTVFGTVCVPLHEDGGSERDCGYPASRSLV